MRRSLSVATEVQQIGVVGDLASAFEGIASLHVARIRDRVISSKAFFAELWQIYTQLRTDTHERFAGSLASHDSKAKNVLMLVTSEGGLSGDIDDRIVRQVVKGYNPAETEIMVLGSHGAILLAQAGVKATKGFRLPDTDTALDVGPIIAELTNYRSAKVFYQTYESLGRQAVGEIDLISAARAIGNDIAAGEVISSKDYIFEPSLYEIAQYMESVVLGLTLSQVILESRLAQYASRFNAMSLAKQRAKDLKSDLTLELRRAKRSESDERLKEIINSYQQ